MKVHAEISSAKGFYIGDVCYALGEFAYHKVWGESCGYRDGLITVRQQNENTGAQFCVASTCWGDGAYAGSDGSVFPVDAGNIGLVPLELVERTKALENGKIVEAPGKAIFDSFDGFFEIKLPNNETMTIDTSWECDDVLDEE